MSSGVSVALATGVTMHNLRSQPSASKSGLGMSGPWAGLPIAWAADERFDEQTYREDIKRCCQAGVPGIYTGGTTGEFFAIEFEEFTHVSLATIKECHSHGTPCMIGITSTATRSILRRAAFAVEHGADAVQLSLPFWIELTDAEILRLFKDLTKVIGGTAFSIYDTPRAKRILGLDLHRAIKDVAPGYKMVKAVSGTLGVTPEGCSALSKFLHVFVSETNWDRLGPLGAVGSCSAMVYWNPGLTLGLWELLQNEQWAKLDIAIGDIQRLHGFLFEQFGVRGFSDAAYDRVMANATGFLGVGLTCRAPYTSPTAADVKLVRAWLRKHLPRMLQL